MEMTTDTVFVRGIPHDTTDEQLMEKFSDVGPVKHAYCLRDKATQRATYGFVKFAIREDAQVAVDTLSGAFLNGKKIQVENAIERGTEGAHKGDIALAKKNRKQQEGKDRQEKKEKRLRTLVLWAPVAETVAKPMAKPNHKHNRARKKKTTTTPSTTKNNNQTPEEYSEESADDEEDDGNKEGLGNDNSSDGSGSGSSSGSSDDGSSSDDSDDEEEMEEENTITDEDLVLAVLSKHAFTNAEVQCGRRTYGDGAFLVTFADANKAKNAYRRLKKVATAFFPKREFNLSLKTKAAESCRLIVRNLAWKATERDLLNVFRHFGPVRSIHFPRQEEKSRGFCFVQYWTRDDALRAVTGANAQTVRDREIAVDLASGEKKQSSSSSSSSNSAPTAVTDDRKGTQEEQDKERANDDGAEDEAPKSDIQDNLTLFVRNLPYGTEEDGLYQAFRAIGPVHYAKIVRDKSTNRSMGTAFVKFRDQSSMKTALNQQPPLAIAGRELAIVRAVSREQAKEIAEASAEEHSNKRKKEDRRHLYLAREGKLTADMESQIPKADAIKRQNADREKQQKLTNPNFFVSPTRLSVRNIARRAIKIPTDISVPGEAPTDPLEPRMIDNKLLKAVFLEAAKKGMRNNLVREDEGDQALMPHTKTAWRHVKIVQAKIVADDTSLTASEENLASRGYGFVQFTEHAHALAALRMLNNNPNYFWCAPGPKASSTPHFKRSRLIVEFAVEDAKKLAKRGKKLIRQSQYNAANNSSSSSSSSSTSASASASAPKSNAKRQAAGASEVSTAKRHKQKKEGRDAYQKKSRGTKRTNGDNDDGGNDASETKMKKRVKKKKKVAPAAAAAASTSGLVSSMKANAKRWFE
jgi:nucleolar protein 4